MNDVKNKAAVKSMASTEKDSPHLEQIFGITNILKIEPNMIVVKFTI